jgi:predicted acyltransferase
MSDNATPSTQAASPPQPSGRPPSRRLVSLDALRGFDMFWIAGGEEVIRGLYKALPMGPTKVLADQMHHKAWGGVAFYDLIFPLFTFIIGVSVVFSVRRMLEQDGLARTLKRIFTRSLTLYILGVLVYGGVSKGWDHVRWLGVLQRLALCYFFTSLLFCFFRLRGLIIACLALLLVYWALASFMPIRDFNLERGHLRAMLLEPDSAKTRHIFLATDRYVHGRFEDGLNLPQQIDFIYLPGRRYDGAYDPEGILSTMPAIATCLLGVFAGLLLKNGTLSDQKKVLWLLAAGLAGLAAGFLWGLQFPVIKKIWTSSYVLVAGGYACLLLAAFHQTIEIWQWRKWCVPFVWIGMNPITVYLAFNLFSIGDVAEAIAGGGVKTALGAWGDLVLSLVAVALMFAMVRFLYQRKIFLRL